MEQLLDNLLSDLYDYSGEFWALKEEKTEKTDLIKKRLDELIELLEQSLD